MKYIPDVLDISDVSDMRYFYIRNLHRQLGHIREHKTLTLVFYICINVNISFQKWGFYKPVYAK